MSLWVCALLLLLLSAAAAMAFIRLRGRKSAAAKITAVLSLCALGAVLLYMALSIFFLYSLRLPDIEIPIPSPTPEPPHPDPLGLRELSFEVEPCFGDIDSLSSFVLYNLMQGRHSFSCRLSPELSAGDGQGSFLLAQACENAMSFYLFSSYSIYNMSLTDMGPEPWRAELGLEFTGEDKDREAREAAKSFVSQNPPPAGGFESFDEERAYALLIHDYLARRLSYSPMGYEPELLDLNDRYASGQEAYNALCGDNGSAVCAAYARGFALIAQYAGIDCAYVSGNDNGVQQHAWNVIFPCDGSEAVIVDVTWDDMLPPSEDGEQGFTREYFYIPVSSDSSHYSSSHTLSFINYLRGLLSDPRRLSH